MPRGTIETRYSAKGCSVPHIRVEVAGPKDARHKAAVLQGVRAGVVEGLGVPNSRVTVRLVEIAPEEISLPACRSANFTIVEVTLFEGRTPQIKHACADAIRTELAIDPGVDATDVFIVFNDKSTDDLNITLDEADV